MLEEINSVSKNKINERTFDELLRQYVFLFIFDGFDEIQESNKSFFI